MKGDHKKLNFLKNKHFQHFGPKKKNLFCSFLCFPKIWGDVAQTKSLFAHTKPTRFNTAAAENGLFQTASAASSTLSASMLLGKLPPLPPQTLSPLVCQKKASLKGDTQLKKLEKKTKNKQKKSSKIVSCSLYPGELKEESSLKYIIPHLSTIRSGLDTSQRGLGVTTSYVLTHYVTRRC